MMKSNLLRIVTLSLLALLSQILSAETISALKNTQLLSPQYFEDFSGTQSETKFIFHGKSYTAYFKNNAVEFHFPEIKTFSIGFNSSNHHATIIPSDQLKATSNYLLGYLAHAQVIKRYGSILYKNIYSNIDLQFYINGSDLEYDFIVHPNGDVSSIKLSFTGMDELRHESGALLIKKAGYMLKQKAPLSYQIISGAKRFVDINYELAQKNNATDVSFNVAQYAQNVDLLIDPVLTHITYLGGSKEDDITDVALDSAGNLYVLGITSSVDFPLTTGSLQTQNKGLDDLFVSKFLVDKDGFTPIFSTYIGGTNSDVGNSLAVDALGNIFITGQTDSTDFPISNSVTPFSATHQGATDSFVIKLNATGTQITHATFIGGSGNDAAAAIALANNGSVYVAGTTNSANFPVKNPIQAALSGLNDGYIAHFDATLNALLFSSFWGGTENETLKDMAIDTGGNVYLVGETLSNNFPTVNPLQALTKGNGDGFVTKINNQNTVVYSSYLGGKFRDYITSVAANNNGEAYVLGFTESPDLAVTNKVWQRTIADDTRVLDPQTGNGGDPLNPIGDLFLSQFNTTGTALSYSTYVGGLGLELPGGLTIDTLNKVYITGSTTSANIFNRFLSGAVNAPGNAFGAVFDLTKPNGSALSFSSIQTGNHSDIARTVVAEPTGQAFYIAGRTESTNLPTLNAGQTAHGGGLSDAFINKFGIGIDLEAFVGFQQGTLIPIGKGLPTTFVFSVINNGPDTATNIQVELTIPSNAQFNQLKIIQGNTTCGSTVPDQNSKIFCTITELLNADSARIDVIMTPQDLVQLTFNIKVKADQADTNPTNNANTFSTIVASFPGEGNIGIPDVKLKPGTGFSVSLLGLILLSAAMGFRKQLKTILGDLGRAV